MTLSLVGACEGFESPQLHPSDQAGRVVLTLRPIVIPKPVVVVLAPGHAAEDEDDSGEQWGADGWQDGVRPRRGVR